MSNVKKGGILYTRNRTPKFQTGATFGAQDFTYSDASLYGDQAGNNFGQQAKANFGTAPRFSNKPDPNAFKKSLAAPKIGPVKPVGYDFNQNKSPGLGNLYGAGTPQLTVAADKITTPSGPKYDAVGVASAVAPVVNMAGDALKNTTDGDDTTFTGKEKTGMIAGSALKGATTGLSTAASVAGAAAVIAPVTTAAVTSTAATALGVGGSTALAGAAAGSVVPIIGTAIGLVIGALVGIFTSKKAKKKARDAAHQRDIKYASMTAAKNRSDNSARDASLVGAPAPTSSVSNAAEGAPDGYLSNRRGGTFHYKMKQSSSENRIKMIKPSPPKKFKRGGSIKATENIIPNGVLHEEFNKIGDKGMPVVKCKNNACEKKYEIERDEMIFTLDTTKKVENLIKEGGLKKLGLFVKSQVLDNTHSFTEKFNDLNTYRNKNESIFT